MDPQASPHNVTLLVAAAGMGTRLGLGPKAFLKLGDKSLLQWVVSIGLSCVKKAIVAAPAGELSRAEEQLAGFPLIQIVEGGSTRQESYQILLTHCDTPLVAIRDVARPLASSALLHRVIDAALTHGAAGAFQAPDTPVAIRDGDFVTSAVPRGNALVPSNPQAYQTAMLRAALERAQVEGIAAQTLWELVLREGNAISIVDGETDNIKVTTQQDWDFLNNVVFPRWLASQSN